MPATSHLQEAAVRASDQERERVAAELREHAGLGRLDMEELDQRLERVYAARTREELASLTRDLPKPAPSPQVERRGRQRADLRGHLASFVLVNALLVAIWAATGADYFWPIWPILGWGIGIASHASEAFLGVRAPFGGHCGRRHHGHRPHRALSVGPEAR